MWSGVAAQESLPKPRVQRECLPKRPYNVKPAFMKTAGIFSFLCPMNLLNTVHVLNRNPAKG